MFPVTGYFHFGQSLFIWVGEAVMGRASVSIRWGSRGLWEAHVCGWQGRRNVPRELPLEEGLRWRNVQQAINSIVSLSLPVFLFKILKLKRWGEGERRQTNACGWQVEQGQSRFPDGTLDTLSGSTQVRSFGLCLPEVYQNMGGGDRGCGQWSGSCLRPAIPQSKRWSFPPKEKPLKLEGRLLMPELSDFGEWSDRTRVRDPPHAWNLPHGIHSHALI